MMIYTRGLNRGELGVRSLLDVGASRPLCSRADLGSLHLRVCVVGYCRRWSNTSGL